MIRTLQFIALIPLLFLAWTAHGEDRPSPASPAEENTVTVGRPVILVRVLSLEGTGPDQREHRLFHDPDGFVTTLDALGRVGYQVRGGELAEGGYHTLFVQLADEYKEVRADGTQTRHRFSDKDKPTRLRIRGMVMVKNGDATPLRMLDAPSYSDLRQKEFRFSHERDDD